MWNLKKSNSLKWRVEWWLLRAGRGGRWEKFEDVGQRVQTSREKMSRYTTVILVQFDITYLNIFLAKLY